MEDDHRIAVGRVAVGSSARRRGVSPRAVLRCAPWLVLSSLLVACTPASTVKPPTEPVPPVVEPIPEPPTEEDEGWKPVTG